MSFNIQINRFTKKCFGVLKLEPKNQQALLKVFAWYSNKPCEYCKLFFYFKMGNVSSMHGRPAEERTGAQKEKLSVNIFIKKFKKN